MFVFGSGVLIGTQLNVPNPTPINFGLVQKVSVDTSVSVKELYGQFAFPVAVGSGTRKVTCKATLARFSGQAIGRLFYNQVPQPGATISQFSEVHSVPASTPFTIAVANATHSWLTRALSTPRTACRSSLSPRLRRRGNTRSTPRLASTPLRPAIVGAVLISYNYTNSSHGRVARHWKPADRPDLDILGAAVRD